jgi:phage terminase large subunit-like protein
MRSIYIAFLMFAISSISNANAEGESVQQQLPKKGKYQFIKKDSIPANLRIFQIYESEKSKKIIFICTPSFFSYTVNALWDLEIKSKYQAEKVASEYCGERLAGYALLGFKINKEIRF